MDEAKHQLVVLLIETAKAHHAGTGGDNERWASWYAARSINESNGLLGTELTVSELADWLEEADRRYQSEAPEESWPKAYAFWLLTEQA